MGFEDPGGLFGFLGLGLFVFPSLESGKDGLDGHSRNNDVL